MLYCGRNHRDWADATVDLLGIIQPACRRLHRHSIGVWSLARWSGLPLHAGVLIAGRERRTITLASSAAGRTGIALQNRSRLVWTAATRPFQSRTARRDLSPDQTGVPRFVGRSHSPCRQPSVSQSRTGFGPMLTSRQIHRRLCLRSIAFLAAHRLGASFGLALGHRQRFHGGAAIFSQRWSWHQRSGARHGLPPHP